MKNLNVLYQSSSLYAIPAAVSICSLFENNKNISEIKVWYIDDGLTSEDRISLENLVTRYRRRIEFLSPQKVERFLSEKNIEKWNGAYATFYKLFVLDEISNVDRLVYIDSDTVINGSLEYLVECDLEGYACGMVASAMCLEIRKYINVDLYYNGGLEVFNLKYWRENDICDALLSNIINPETRYRYTVIADETLINAALTNRIKKLPLEYNCEATWWLWGADRGIRKKLGWRENEGFYSANDVDRAYKSPIIMHYMNLTTGRPWDYLNDHPFSEYFYKYLNVLGPWKSIDFESKGFGGENKLLLQIKWICKKLMPWFVRRRIGFRQHREACLKAINRANIMSIKGSEC